MSSLEEAGPQVEVASTKTAAPCDMSGVSVGDERGSPAHHSKDGLGTEPEPEDLWRARTHTEVSALIRALHGCQPVRVYVFVHYAVKTTFQITKRRGYSIQFPVIGWKASFERRIVAKCTEQ